ncbi:hypothetical protein AB205_0131820 [Aquarana catesbeiana]|uniref:glutathione peroxidase n=1 Tax=Aquarana catesbeiana TaxID=8400 RepID=A0A2G9QLW7_AQUCT|nr:hypothetical protein AB205_0131820 [Aquarana catesbeiana]
MQYIELNALQEELRGTGFVILGFPCNQFGLQEPGSNDEILNGLKTECTTRRTERYWVCHLGISLQSIWSTGTWKQ